MFIISEIVKYSFVDTGYSSRRLSFDLDRKGMKMSKQRRVALMVRWSLGLAIGIAMFWLVLVMVTGYMPICESIRVTPFWLVEVPAIPRIWDFILGPIYTVLCIGVLYNAGTKGREDLIGATSCIILGTALLGLIGGLAYIKPAASIAFVFAVLGGFAGLRSNLRQTMTVGASAGVGFGLGVGLTGGLIPGVCVGVVGMIVGVIIAAIMFVFLQLCKRTTWTVRNHLITKIKLRLGEEE